MNIKWQICLRWFLNKTGETQYSETSLIDRFHCQATKK